MEIVNRDEILKYLQITLLSYSRICYFVSAEDHKTRIKARFLDISARGIHARLSGIPKGFDGVLVFFSYTFIFRFRAKLKPGEAVGVVYCDIPSKIETFDRRKFARLKFESRENKVVTIFNRTLKHSIKGLLTDISAGGMGLTVADVKRIPRTGDVIMTEVQLKDKRFVAIAQVAHVHENQIGCGFLEKEMKFQMNLNTLIRAEVTWRSEVMLRNLKKREEMMKSFRQAQAKEAEIPKGIEEKLDFLDPLLDYFMESFHAVSGIALSREGVEYKKSTASAFLAALHQPVFFNVEPLFKSYVTAADESLYAIAKSLFDDQLGGQGVNAEIVLQQLGRKLEGFSGRPGSGKSLFYFSGSQAVKFDKKILSRMMQQPSVRVKFNSSAGAFQLTLMADDLEEALNFCAKAREREFITMDKLDLLQPISYSTLKVFSEAMNLEIREKSVTNRDRLLPRFEISVLLDIFFEDIEGKVVLNMSKRLALKIYETLLGEPVEEFNTEVKDAVAEVVNMITGNAKSDFEEQGIYYKLGTPIVLESKEGVIVYATNMKFLSSVYWTSHGFFDLSFSFFKK